MALGAHRETRTDKPAVRPAVAFLTRNVTVQLGVCALVTLVALPILPWPAVAGWVAVTLAIAWMEETWVLPNAELQSAAASQRLRAALVAFASTACSAAAAFALVVWGKAAAREFSFALMTVSMVYA